MRHFSLERNRLIKGFHLDEARNIKAFLNGEDYYGMWMKWENSKDKIEIFLWGAYYSKNVFVVVVVFRKKTPKV